MRREVQWWTSRSALNICKENENRRIEQRKRKKKEKIGGGKRN